MGSGDPPLDTSLLLYALQIHISIKKFVSNIKKMFAALHEPVLLFYYTGIIQIPYESYHQISANEYE